MVRAGLSYLTKLKKQWVILVIILLGLTPLLWFKPGYIIASGDYFPIWFNSLSTIHQDIFSWESANAGQISLWPLHIIYESVWYILQWLHISVNIIQIMSQIFFSMGAGISIYYLALTIYKGQKITALVSSIFYMFNFFMLFSKLNPAASWMLVFLPLWIALYIKVVERLKTNRSTVKYSILFALNSMVLLSFSAQNPPLLIISGLSIGIIFLYYFIFNKGLRLRLITNLFALLAICLAINIWWLMLLWMTYQPSSVSILSTWGATGDIVKAISYYHNRASFLNLFWMNGIWSWTDEYFSYIHTYDNPMLRVITFVPMAMAFAGLLFKNNKYGRFNCYLAVIVLISLFLQKGLHAPFTNVNSWLYTNVPGFIGFREPSKFGFLSLTFLALLIGSSTNSILSVILKDKSKFRNWLSYVFVGAIIIVFLSSTFPLLTGDIFGEGTEKLPFPAHVKFPDYWYQASDWINSQDGDFRVLLTPQDDFYAMPFVWGYYGSDTFPLRLINKPVLQQVYGYTIDKPYSELMAKLYNTTNENSTKEFRYLLNVLNVRYILQRNDIPSSPGRSIAPASTMRTFLHSQVGITQIKTFGALDLYEISREDSPPHIYLTAVPVLVNGSIDEMLEVAASDESLSAESVVFLSDQQSAEQMQFISNLSFLSKYENDTPEVVFQKINPTEYKVHIKNANRPFFLIFSENYHPGWKAYVSDEKVEGEVLEEYTNVNVSELKQKNEFIALEDFTRIFEKPLKEEDHFLVNGYANGWYIDKNGEYTVTIQFEPQIWFYYALLISSISLILSLAYLAYTWLKERGSL